ncbi:MAG: electron transport complex subunit RsxC [Clostridia bacterium]|nr:electron transport complex subunit RsxC [Clostridia bacterium]
MLFKKLSGVRVKHCKNTADLAPVRISVPKTVYIPMAMHIGAPAVLAVKVGDAVKVGTLIGESGAGLSSPVYSSVSGTVKKIDEIIAIAGNHVSTVVIESDGEQTIDESISPYDVNTKEAFLEALRKSGIVGLGGAGFPTPIKLNADNSRVDTLVINGAECEPYITSDTRTMLDGADDVAYGISLICKFLEIDNVVIGIEKNKPQCISSMRKATEDMAGVRVMPLPSVYPQGGEKVLAYHTTGRVIPQGKLPLDVGIIVINCTTVAAIAKFIRTGMPLVEKCVTVDGSAVSEPKNLIAPIGTPVGELIKECGGFKEEPRKVLYGGPMMGIALPDLTSPILKQTNAVIFMGEKEATPPPVTPCIKCGACIEACPLSLDPVAISKAYKAGEPATLERLKVDVCMECGCCSYVCPAKRNIVQRNKMAKSMLRDYKIKQKATEEKKNG